MVRREQLRGWIVALFLLVMVTLQACASVTPAQSTKPEAPVPQYQKWYEDFITRGESVGKYWEEARGVTCGRMHLNAIPVRFCENPDVPENYVAYAYCEGKLLGEAHGIRKTKNALIPDLSDLRVYLFNGSRVLIGAKGRPPKPKKVEANQEIIQVTIHLPLEGGGEARLVVERPEERCMEVPDLD